MINISDTNCLVCYGKSPHTESKRCTLSAVRIKFMEHYTNDHEEYETDENGIRLKTAGKFRKVTKKCSIKRSVEKWKDYLDNHFFYRITDGEQDAT